VMGFFKIGSPEQFVRVWLQTVILLILTSWVARIIDTWLKFLIFKT
jgi:hypothetical protein